MTGGEENRSKKKIKFAAEGASSHDPVIASARRRA